jgi:hypothetical protein
MRALLIKIIKACLWLYCGLAFFDPADSILGAKLPVFAAAVLLALGLNRFQTPDLPKELRYRLLFLTLLIPAAGLLVFLIRHPGGDLRPGLSLVKGLWASLLILPAAAAGADLKKPVFLCLGIMAAVIVGLRYCAGWAPALFREISLFLNMQGVALIGSRSFGEIELPMIFFVTIPLAVLAVPFLVNRIFGAGAGRGKRFWAAGYLGLLLLAVYFSAARALSLVLLLECLACFLYVIRRRVLLATGTLVLAAALFLAGLTALLQTQLLSAGEQSNSIKIAHFQSFLELVNDDPVLLLTGDGLGAVYHSRAPGVNQEVYQTELTYVDMVRYFGLAGSLLLLMLLFLPLSGPGDKGLLAIGLGSYFVVAGNNPLLFNSTGMLAIVFFWSQQTGPVKEPAAGGRLRP